MTDHKLDVNEDAETADATGEGFAVVRKPYKVVNPLFKNGKNYKKGSVIELDDKTAENFLAAGDIKEK
jgi:hypothetical protein